MKTQQDDLIVGQAYNIDIRLEQGCVSFRDHCVMIDEAKNEIIFGDVKVVLPSKFIWAERV